MIKPSAYAVYLIMGGASSIFSTTIFTVLAVYYVKTVGLNPLQLVLVGTILESTVFLFEVPTGVVADTYSRRLSVIIGQFLIGVCYVIEGLMPLFAAILIAEVIRGIGETFISGALSAWIADEIGEENAGRAYLRYAQVRQIGALIGTFASVGLASIQLNLPIVLGGALIIGLGVFLIIAMPERGFQPTPRGERTSWQAMGNTLRHSVQIVRQSPLMLIILCIGVVFGAFSEGFDRLWEAHFLTNFKFPKIGSLDPVVWFGIINSVSMLLNLGAAETARRYINTNDHVVVSRTLLAINALLMISVIAFGLAKSFALAIGARWLASMLRTIHSPIYTAWINQNLNPKVRATVISMSGQADALGQLTGGPIIGVIGTAFSLRTAMVASGLLLSPVLALYGRAIKGRRE